MNFEETMCIHLIRRTHTSSDLMHCPTYTCLTLMTAANWTIMDPNQVSLIFEIQDKNCTEKLLNSSYNQSCPDVKMKTAMKGKLAMYKLSLKFTQTNTASS